MARAPAAQKTPATDAAKIAGHWIGEIDTSEKWQTDYLARCRRIIRRYKQDTYQQNGVIDSSQRRFSILWSNIQTLGPAVYARTPEPVVGRRFKDNDPTARMASEVLERALRFSVEQYDFDERMEECRDDYLLLARGQIWVRYMPPEQPQAVEAGEQISNSRDGTGPADQVYYQEVICDHVAYSDWGMQPCRTWDETGYVWRTVFMTRAALVKRFGPQVGNMVPLDWRQKDMSPGGDVTEVREREKRAAIYEIWDKTSGQVIWISKSVQSQVLDMVPDPLGLTDFFPCPRPLVGTLAPDSYIPIPDYVFYQDQAEELDELTQRIGTLTDALKLVGIYASEYGVALSNMFTGANNQMIPIEGMASLQDKGGLKGIVEWFPVADVIGTLQGCFNTRKQILDDIYQITGISDILRGDTDPNETATAQGIKSQWGSLRVRDRQRDIQRFARDVLRIKAQIIASKFSEQTLMQQTNMQMLTNQQKQQIQIAQRLDAQSAQQYQAMQQQAQQPQPQGGNVTPFPGGQPQQAPQPQQMPPMAPPQQILPQLLAQMPPGAMDLVNQPSWEDVIALLRDNSLRSFRVDVETDSTVEPDEDQDKARRVEFLNTVGAFLGSAVPLVQQIPELAPLMAESVKFLTRGFRVGAEMEDVIDKTFDKLAQMPPQPPPGQKGPQGMDPMAAQLGQGKLQLQQQQMQSQAQIAQGKLALEAAELQGQQQRNAADVQTEQARIASDHQLGLAKAQIEVRGQDLDAAAISRDPHPQVVV